MSRGRWVRAVVAGALGAAVGLAPMVAAPALALVPGGSAAPGMTRPNASPRLAARPHDVTSRLEARRVDRVPAPKLNWFGCVPGAQCATVRLPLDYDHPTGPKTEIALARVPASDQKHKLGTLFVNPGGPGGSGVELAFAAPYFLDESLLQRFDIVGFDPRGTNYGDQVKCFPSLREQLTGLRGLQDFLPRTRAQQDAEVAAARRYGRACSTTGQPLVSAMSTAEVARDMDVLRRAVGDQRLSYLGFSYGSYLGEVYANLFPDRVRALTIDGVINPVQWAGSLRTRRVPQWDRTRGADGATRALHALLVRCDRAGGQSCVFAPGNPVANYDLVARRLKAHPVVFDDPFFGPFRFGYPDLVGSTLIYLYDAYGADEIAYMMSDLIIVTEPPNARAHSLAADSRYAAARRDLVKRITAQRKQARKPRLGFPYDNSLDAFSAVTCTDGFQPLDAAAFPRAAAAADRRARYFGALRVWQTVQCASRTFTAHDEDGYRGPFTHRTVAPVLVVGNLWDPATNYDGAVATAKLMPGSRLLTSTNWGHTAYGTSACVTDAMDAYLLAGKLPKVGKVCAGDYQPFADSAGFFATGPGRRSLPSVLPPGRPIL